MIFVKHNIPTILNTNGYYITVYSMYTRAKYGPFSENTAKLFCRFVERFNRGIIDNVNHPTSAQQAELMIWSKDFPNEYVDKLTGIIKSDIKLYSDYNIINEIKTIKFNWYYDPTYDTFDSIIKYTVKYIEDNKEYKVVVDIDEKDLYDTTIK